MVIALQVVSPLAAARQPTTPDQLSLANRPLRGIGDETSDALGMGPGIVRSDQIVHLRGFGRADELGRPSGPETPFIMASVGKSFTAWPSRSSSRPAS
jgi:CubicO group peptidase (beta-lactamase class C family)